MKKIGQEKIIITVGLVALAAATWLALRTPTAPALPVATMATSSQTMAEATTTSGGNSNTSTKPVTSSGPAVTSGGGKTNYIRITITDPVANTQWVIGKQNTITWSKAAGSTGQMYLVNAATGVVVGWIQQNVAPGQTYFPWNTRDLSLSRTNPGGKTVVPGEYIIKMSFASPEALPATSAPFTIVAMPANE